MTHSSSQLSSLASPAGARGRRSPDPGGSVRCCSMEAPKGLPICLSAEDVSPEEPAILGKQEHLSLVVAPPMAVPVAASASAAEATKVRKPYTITKSRESWTGPEHDKFLEALRLLALTLFQRLLGQSHTCCSLRQRRVWTNHYLFFHSLVAFFPSTIITGRFLLS